MSRAPYPAEPPLRVQIEEMWRRIAEHRRQLDELQRETDAEVAAYAVQRMGEREQREQRPAPPPPVPLTMAEQAAVPAVGSESRARRLTEIAEQHGLRLEVPLQRREALERLFEDERSTVFSATTLTEGIYALARDRGLSFTQLGDGPVYAGLCESVAKLRPDLRPDYRGGRVAPEAAPDPRIEVDRLIKKTCERRGWDLDNAREVIAARQIVFQERPDLARAVYLAESEPMRRPDPEHDKAVQFTELVNAHLREQDVPGTPENRVRAARTVAREHPHLAPSWYRR